MRYLIEVEFGNDKAHPTFLTIGGEPVLVDEKDLEPLLRHVRAGTGDLGDWVELKAIGGDWKVTKILAYPLGEPVDVTHPPVPIPLSFNDHKVFVDNWFRAPDGSTYYSCRWQTPDMGKSFLVIYDGVTAKLADGTMLDSVEWG